MCRTGLHLALHKNMIRTKGEGSSDGGEGCMEEKDDDNDDRDEVRGRSVGEGSGDDDVLVERGP